MQKQQDDSYDACTIFCTGQDYATVVRTLEQVSLSPIKVRGKADRWKSITIQGHTSTLTFNRRFRKKPGDDFCGMMLGALNYFRNIKTNATQQQQRIATLLGACSFAVGVVGQPEFVESDGHFECIFAVCAAVGGLIFNGSGMVDAEGNMVLDGDGTSEL